MWRSGLSVLAVLVGCRFGFDQINGGLGTDGDGGVGNGDGTVIQSGHVAQACIAIPASGTTFPMGVAVDGQGQPYLLTRFSGTFQIGATTLTNTNRDDALIIAYDKSCGVRWYRQIVDTANTG